MMTKALKCTNMNNSHRLADQLRSERAIGPSSGDASSLSNGPTAMLRGIDAVRSLWETERC